jgi:hypothetical protein
VGVAVHVLVTQCDIQRVVRELGLDQHFAFGFAAARAAGDLGE